MTSSLTQVESVGQYEIDLSGPGGSATFLGVQPGTTYPTGWINVAASILDSAPPSGWTVESGTWIGLLNDVTQVQIPIELVTNNQSTPWSDIEGVDNVMLTGTAPEPGSLSLMGLGAGVLGLALIRRRRTRA